MGEGMRWGSQRRIYGSYGFVEEHTSFTPKKTYFQLSKKTAVHLHILCTDIKFHKKPVFFSLGKKTKREHK
jgi:hypothetical protein